MKLTQKTIKSINTFGLLALGYGAIYLAIELGYGIPSMVLFVLGCIFIFLSLVSVEDDEEPKPLDE